MECLICSKVPNYTFDSKYGEDLSHIVCKVLEISTHSGYFNSSHLCFICLQKIDQVERIMKDMDEIKLRLSKIKIEFEDDLIRTHKLNKSFGHQGEKRKEIIKEICSRSKDDDVDMDNFSNLTEDGDDTKKDQRQSFSTPSSVPTLSLEPNQNQNHGYESDTDFEDFGQDQDQHSDTEYQEVIPTPPIVFEGITFEGLNKLQQFENKTFSSTNFPHLPPVPSSSSSSFQQFRENNNNNSQKKPKYTINSSNFCNDCNLVFTSEHLLNQHQKEYHSSSRIINQSIKNSNSVMIGSNEVSVIYESEPIYTQSQSQSQQYDEKSNIMKSSSSQKYQCVYCPKRYTYPHGLKAHIEIIHQNIRYPCPEPDCPMEYSKKASMRQHFERVHSKRLFVAENSRKFADPADSYKMHQPSHESNKKLAVHQDDEYSHKCPLCNAKYLHRYSLTRHIKTNHS